MVKTKSSPKDLKTRFAEYRLHVKAENKKFADGMRQIKADFQKGTEESKLEFKEAMKKVKSDFNEETSNDIDNIKERMMAAKTNNVERNDLPSKSRMGAFAKFKEENRLLILQIKREAKEKEEADRIKREAKEDARIQRIRDSVGTKKASKGPNPFFVTLELLWVMAISLPLLIMMILALALGGFLIWSLIF